MVIAFHAGLPLPGGFAGVDVFFVISGFVITAMLQREWSRAGRISLRRFYTRRFVRLTPALAVTVTVTMLLTAAVISPLGPQQNAAATAVGSMFIVANVVIANTTGGYFSAAAETNPLLNVWSLSVEEQFYLLFPLMLILGWALARRRRTRLAPVVVVACVAALSFALALVDENALSFPGAKDALGFYSPLPRAWEFAVGALVALCMMRRRRASTRLATAAGILGLAGLALTLFVIDSSTPFPGLWTLLPVAATLLLLIAGQADANNPVSRMLSCRPLVAIGDRSYSLYLWHWPIIVIASALFPDAPGMKLIAAVIAAVPAIASYRFVEQPLRRRRYSKRSLGALVSVTLGVPLVVATLVWVGSTSGYGNATIQAFQRATKAHYCPNERRLPGATVECSFDDSASGPPVYLIGDSHAAHIRDAVASAAGQTDSPFASRVSPACQAFDTVIGTVGAPAVPHCAQYFADTMAWLDAAEPGVVVISTAWRPFWDDTVRLGPSEQEMSVSSTDKLRFLREGLAHTVRALSAAGHRVVLTHDVPVFTDDLDYEPAECGLLRLASGDCDRVMPRRTALAQLDLVKPHIDAVARETGSKTIDFFDLLCDDEGCPTRIPEFVIYGDSNHISADASLMLAVAFVPLIQDLEETDAP
ncbi:acyltransferase family protein [Microbacterium awajiense]|uniref:Acyltransferase family protein n=2 Tax=Microbacterium awajiense TaxID=415214 RepID=A0ABP7AMG0_9MICO